MLSGPPQTTSKRLASGAYCAASKRLKGGTKTGVSIPISAKIERARSILSSVSAMSRPQNSE